MWKSQVLGFSWGLFREVCCSRRYAISLGVSSKVVVPHIAPKLANTGSIWAGFSEGKFWDFSPPYTAKCLLCSFRRCVEGNKSPGYHVCVRRGACVVLLWGQGDLSTTGSCQQWSELFGSLGHWLYALLNRATIGWRVHLLLYALALQHSQENGVRLCVDEVACVIGVEVCGIFRANPVHGIKYEEQYWAVINLEHWWLRFLYKRFNTVWASVLYMAMHKNEL